MSSTDQKEAWKPAVRREMATWGVSHASLEGGLAAMVARAVKEEREACAVLCESNADLQRIRAKAEGNDYATERVVEAMKCARAIRARSER